MLRPETEAGRVRQASEACEALSQSRVAERQNELEKRRQERLLGNKQRRCVTDFKTRTEEYAGRLSPARGRVQSAIVRVLSKADENSRGSQNLHRLILRFHVRHGKRVLQPTDSSVPPARHAQSLVEEVESAHPGKSTADFDIRLCLFG